MSDKERILHQILTASQTGTISCRLAEKLGILPYEAFCLFFRSKTYEKFRTPGSVMSMLGDPAIVREFLIEQGMNGSSH